MKVKRGKIARRQKKLQVEEEHWMQHMLKRCWDQLQPEVQERVVVAAGGTQSLDAILKDEPVVAVKEVSPG